MDEAFQEDAFQNDAFQIVVEGGFDPATSTGAYQPESVDQQIARM